MRKYSLLLCFMLMLACALTSCKPKYVSPLESPRAEMPENAPQELDFVQMHNNVIEQFSGDETYMFVKALDINGSNEPKEISVEIEVMEKTADEAVEVFLSQLITAISQDACAQDMRYTAPDAESFGSVFDSYKLHYTVMRGAEIYLDEEIDTDTEIPVTPGLEIDL